MGKSLSKIGGSSSTRIVDCPNSAADDDDDERNSKRSVKDKVLEENLAYYAELEKEKVKILLLGSENCGKSTILEQLRLVYGDPYTDEELALFLAIIHRNMLDGMKILIQQAKRLKISGRVECTRAMNNIESQSFSSGQYLPSHIDRRAVGRPDHPDDLVHPAGIRYQPHSGVVFREVWAALYPWVSA
jgi:hypothetical protein